ncbi:MAG: cell surface protein [Candidatus Sumerlaeota bacterium]|nr:cell surface protein [Candidatus Sumerlaeota bacterium]
MGNAPYRQIALLLSAWLLGWPAAGQCTEPSNAAADAVALGPCAVAIGNGGAALYIAEALAKRIDVLDTAANRIIASFGLSATPTGLAFSPNGARVYVTTFDSQGGVASFDTASGTTVAAVPAGHGACAPVASPSGAELFVCNRFDNDVSVFDLAIEKEVARIPVLREPVAAALTPDGARLFVANHLPAGRSDVARVAAAVSVIDVAARKVVATVDLPNGSGSVRGICCSPDGAHIYVTHLLAHFEMPTTQVDRGWMNTNALTVIDAREMKRVNTVLLDSVDRGAANPWGVACSADGRAIGVAHAGTREVSLIAALALLDKLAQMPEELHPTKAETDTGFYIAPVTQSLVPNDLSFLVGLRRRIGVKGVGPRAVAVSGSKFYAADYFSDSLSLVDASEAKPRAVELPLAAKPFMDEVRRGEMLFNDATTCFQQWQSCASCHPDARSDGLNWDLLNDGLGNPKNAKSMLLSHQTPPAMATGVRPDAETAVRLGMRLIQFSTRPETEAQALDAYLKSLKPVPSPRLVNGRLSPAAERGKALFFGEANCGACHPAPLYTDRELHDVGTGSFGDPGGAYDTPALVEVWRSAPYLHDGRCATIEEALTTGNPGDRHGRTSHLTPDQIADLAEFVDSL